MKRILSIAILFVMVTLLATTVVNATTTSTLADELYALASKYGMTSADKVKIERYLADNPVTENEANQVMAKAEEAVQVMKDEGVTSIEKLSTAKKDEVVAKAKAAAEVIDVKLEVSGDKVTVSKDGKVIEQASVNNGKLAYTGNNISVVLAVISVAVVALAAAVVARKKIANA